MQQKDVPRSRERIIERAAFFGRTPTSTDRPPSPLVARMCVEGSIRRAAEDPTRAGWSWTQHRARLVLEIADAMIGLSSAAIEPLPPIYEIARDALAAPGVPIGPAHAIPNYAFELDRDVKALWADAAKAYRAAVARVA